LDSRVLIEQAKGLLAGEHEITVDEAFERLRHHARLHNIRLATVCEAVVNQGRRISDEKSGSKASFWDVRAASSRMASD
jgi:hypothetical protein